MAYPQRFEEGILNGTPFLFAKLWINKLLRTKLALLLRDLARATMGVNTPDL